MRSTLLYFFIITLLGICSACSNTNKKEDLQMTNSDKKENVSMNDSSNTADTATVAVIKTNMGTIEISFLPHYAPKAVENFIGLAKKGYYNGIIFHRVIKGFMIQGGDPTGTGMGGQSLWGGRFKDEISPDLVFDKPGIVAMANAGPNTNGSQFFITVAATPWLNGHYTIFGEVIKGMDVVYAISKVKTNPQNDKPLENVVMEKVTIEQAPGNVK